MIRPITVLTFFLACGSGMYLYQEKHHVHVLDQQIDETVRQTGALREQTRALHAEWMLLNDPDRLRVLANQYLTSLQPVSPTQFTDLADLDSRLPPPVPPTAAPTAQPAPGRVVATAPNAPPVTPDGQGTTNSQGTDTQTADGQTADGQTADGQAAADALPMPPAAPSEPPPPDIHTVAAVPVVRPAPQPVVTAATPMRPDHVPVWKPAVPRPVVADAAPQRFMPPRFEPPRFVPVEQRPMPVARPIVVSPVYGGGSMLGMARSTQNLPAPQPLPRPVPMNAAYDNQGG